MIKKLSNAYADALVSYGIITQDQKDIYTYGFTAFIVNIINYSIFLILGICFNSVIETILFFLFYVSLRNIIGGFHARTPIKCLFYGIMMWAIVIAIYKSIILTQINLLLLTIAFSFNLIFIIRRKTISRKRKQIGIIYLSVLPCIELCIILMNSQYSSIITLSLLCNLLMNLKCFNK